MKHWKNLTKKLFSVTPFRVTFTIVTFFIILAFLQDVSLVGLPVVSTIDNKALDVKFAIRGPQKPNAKIIIVAADEKSLQTFGQWPFDRAKVFAPFFEKICSYDVKSVGLDFFWPEHEKNMSGAVKHSVRELARKAKVEHELDEILENNSGDAAMRKAAERCGHRLVWGYDLEVEPRQFDGPAQKRAYEARIESWINSNRLQTVVKTPGARIPTSIEQADKQGFLNTEFMHFYFGALLSNQTMVPPGSSEGFFSNKSEDDGNYRHYLPVASFAGSFVPSLALKMAMKHFAEPGQTEAQPVLFVPDVTSGKSLSLRIKAHGELTSLPVDKSGRLIVNYHGPNAMYPHVSLAEILSPSETITYTPAYEYHVLTGGNPSEPPKPVTFLKREFFKGAHVLVGGTATGMHDIRPRPLDNQAYGVENHANALDNFLTGDFLERPNAETLVIVLVGLYIIGLLYGVAINKLSAKPGALFAAVTIGGLLYLDQVYLFNNKRVVFGGHWQAFQFLLQYLSLTVLKYIKEETDKKFIRSAFDKFVSPAVIENMLSDPTKLQLGGEKKELTILFSDIAGFTEMSERIEAKVLTQFLNEYLGAMTDIVQANNGTLDKYIGDAVMAFWGAPIDNPNHAQAGVKTAVEMQRKIAELNKQFSAKYGFEIEVRIGLNSGDVSVGNFGSSKVFEYTVIGDNVNLASRLEGVNKYYGTSIIVSESTHNLLSPGQFVSREIDTIKVKGKHKAVKIFEILPHAADESSVLDLLKPFREGLMNYYARHFDRAVVNFEEVLKKNKKDKASQEFIERCQYYKSNPPASDWDGSWEMQSK